MASPQLENGFTRIANEIMEHLASCRISGREWQVLLVIIRKTYGFKKKIDYISMGQFSILTGMKRPDVAEQIKKLLGKNLIGVTQNPNTNGINSYIFQKDWDKWKVLPKKLTVPQNPNPLLPKTLTEGVPQNPTHKRKNTKDTITKEIKHTYGAYRHVCLTDIDHAKLIGKLGEAKTAEWITTLDEGIELKGYRYKSHYLAILKWIEKEKKSDTLISESEKCQYDNKIICSYNCSGCDKQKKKVL